MLELRVCSGVVVAAVGAADSVAVEAVDSVAVGAAVKEAVHVIGAAGFLVR